MVEANSLNPVVLRMPRGKLQRRVGKLHHVRALVGCELEATREIHVQDVEPARAESEPARLDVDHHLVTDGDGAGQQRVGDTRSAVDLDPRKPLLTFDDRGHAAAAEAKGHARARCRRAPA